LKILVLCLFCDFASTKGAFLIDKQGLEDAFVTKGVVAISDDGTVEDLVADGAPVLIFELLLC
jgi:hypothetical protein